MGVPRGSRHRMEAWLARPDQPLGPGLGMWFAAFVGMSLGSGPSGGAARCDFSIALRIDSRSQQCARVSAGQPSTARHQCDSTSQPKRRRFSICDGASGLRAVVSAAAAGHR